MIIAYSATDDKTLLPRRPKS